MQSIASLPGPRGIPLLGARQLAPETAHLRLEEWCERHGPIFRFDTGGRRWMAIGEMEAIAGVLRERPDVFARIWPAPLRPEAATALGPLWQEGQQWRRTRRLAIASLDADHLHRYFHATRVASGWLRRGLQERARDGGPLAIGEQLADFAVDACLALSFGFELRSLERSHGDLRALVQAASAALPGFPGAVVAARRPARASASALPPALGELQEALATLLADARRRASADSSPQDGTASFVSAMLAARGRQGDFEDGEILGTAAGLLLAGSQSTASAAAWALWLAARDHDIQARIAREASKALGDSPSPSDLSTVSRLRFCRAVVLEALRLKPATPILAVQPVVRTTIMDITLPPGTPVCLLLRYATTDGDIETVNVEQWLNDAQTPEGGPFLAFGSGARFCPGKTLALMLATTALAMIVRNFHVELDSETVIEHAGPLSMEPRGLMVRLREREASGRLR